VSDPVCEIYTLYVETAKFPPILGFSLFSRYSTTTSRTGRSLEGEPLRHGALHGANNAQWGPPPVVIQLRLSHAAALLGMGMETISFRVSRRGQEMKPASRAAHLAIAMGSTQLPR